MTASKTRLTLSTLLLALFLLGCQSQSKPNQAAHELLEAYMDDVTGFAGSAPAMMKSLAEHERDLDLIKGQVPEAFTTRYRRLISTTRLLVAQKRSDSDTQQIAAFVQSVTGVAPPPDPSKLIVVAAGALSDEVLRLDMLLDGETDLRKVRAHYADRIRAKKRA